MNESISIANAGGRMKSFRPRLLSVSRVAIRLALAALCFVTVGAHAQQAAANSGWERVKALPPGIVVDVKSSTLHMHCKLGEVTDETLTCTHGPGANPEVFQRAAIVSIKIGRRGRSALIGAGIGAAALGVTGFAATSSRGDSFFGPNFLRGPATGVGAAAGAVIGAGIGALTDFSKSTIYKAP